MTTPTLRRRTVAHVYPAPPTDTAPTVLRLHNPWTAHLLAACAVAGVTTVGAFVSALLGDVRLDLSAFAVLAGWGLVVALSYAHTRYDRVRTLVAEPVDPQVTGGVR